jgi:hypothetical protein
MDGDDDQSTKQCATRPCGYGTKIFTAIIKYLKTQVDLMSIQVRWVPYIQKPIANEYSKAIQFFVKKLHFEVPTRKSSLHYLSLDIKKHYS